MLTVSPPPRSRPGSSTCASASAQGVVVTNVLAAAAGYGSSEDLAAQNINLEFVSANPTGPIHIGGTRWAAVGDALGRLLSTQGARKVTREYYFNDRLVPEETGADHRHVHQPAVVEAETPAAHRCCGPRAAPGRPSGSRWPGCPVSRG